MKKIITLLVIVLHVYVGFSQNNSPIKKGGNFYEFRDLWLEDSVALTSLINKYSIELKELDSVCFFEDFKFNKKLHNEYQFTSYVYMLDKKTGEVTFDSIPHHTGKSKLNKYVLIYCFDDDSDKKIINIKVF